MWVFIVVTAHTNHYSFINSKLLEYAYSNFNVSSFNFMIKCFSNIMNKTCKFCDVRICANF